MPGVSKNLLLWGLSQKVGLTPVPALHGLSTHQGRWVRMSPRQALAQVHQVDRAWAQSRSRLQAASLLIRSFGLVEWSTRNCLSTFVSFQHWRGPSLGFPGPRKRFRKRPWPPAYPGPFCTLHRGRG